ncbi:MAG: GtrA family protein [Candidatus Aenigmarchaeota archaeon]
MAGVVATLSDWGLFYLLAVFFNVYYQFSLAAALILGAIVHYTLNKIFTFRCKSRAIVRQLSVYAGVIIISLGISSVFMFLFIDIFLIFKMYARMLTTFIMIMMNYLLQKYLTFSKIIFK